jgi:hypothetical protein
MELPARTLSGASVSFINSTPFQALDVPLRDHTGREVVVAIAKATFTIERDGHLRLAEEPSPVRVNDVLHRPADPRSSAQYPSDVCVQKRGADVVVLGDAISPHPATTVDVAIKVRNVTVPLRVHGERRFFRNVMEVAVSSPVPFERQPIVYERSYGGVSDDFSMVEPRNPSGVGVARRDSELIDRLAPQIEHPALPHRSPRDKHPPVGFGALLPHWSPRRDHAGTFDETWSATRMPLMPRDFDIRHDNVAHPSLSLDRPMERGDPIAVLGMSETGVVAFEVPDLRIVMRARFDRRGTVEVPAAIDTVLVEPNERRVELVVRRAFPVGRGRDLLREVVVDTDG